MYGIIYDPDYAHNYGVILIDDRVLVYGEPMDDWIITASAGVAHLCHLTPEGRYEVKYRSEDKDFVHDMCQYLRYRDRIKAKREAKANSIDKKASFVDKISQKIP